jgi:hypothetical protein
MRNEACYTDRSGDREGKPIRRLIARSVQRLWQPCDDNRRDDEAEHPVIGMIECNSSSIPQSPPIVTVGDPAIVTPPVPRPSAHSITPTVLTPWR